MSEVSAKSFRRDALLDPESDELDKFLAHVRFAREGLLAACYQTADSLNKMAETNRRGAQKMGKAATVVGKSTRDMWSQLS